MGPPPEQAEFLDLGAAGVRDLAPVGLEFRDGFGAGGPAGGHISIFAYRQTYAEVVELLTSRHGEPERLQDVPAWAAGSAWSRQWERERAWHGATITVLDGLEARPPGTDVEAIPDDAVGLLWIDRAYGVRAAPEPRRPEPPQAPTLPDPPVRRSIWSRLLRRG
ncbi:MAG: hypothetical protein AAGA99_24535 [Actinomycetota bacterium]